MASSVVCCVQLRSMAPTTQHLIFLSAIPVIYPALGVLESLLVSFEGVRKGGMTEAILNKTGAPHNRLLEHNM